MILEISIKKCDDGVNIILRPSGFVALKIESDIPMNISHKPGADGMLNLAPEDSFTLHVKKSLCKTLDIGL